MSETTIRLKNNQSAKHKRDKVVTNGEPIPKVPLYLAASVIVLTLIVVFSSRFYDVQSWKIDTGQAVKTRDLVFILHDDETITVKDAVSNALIEKIPENQDGFLHGALRAIKRERLVKQVDALAPMRLIHSEDGSYTLDDTATGRSFYLRAFGKDNLAAVARFIDAPIQSGGE